MKPALLSVALDSPKTRPVLTDVLFMSSIPFVTRFYRAGPRKRLWMAGSALGVFLLTLIVGNHFIATDKSVTREMLGHDFLAFYTAGSFVRDGRAHDLYNLDAVRDFEQATAHAAGLEVGKSFGPWWNPPFYALVFEPLAALPYGRALDLWRWISVFAVVVAITLLASIVRQASLSTRWQQWMLPPLLICISMPFIQAISHGQNTFTSLLILTGTVVLWRDKRGLAAGALCGLLFYKPQLGAVVAAAMVLDLGFTALGGLCVTGAFLLFGTLLAMPGSLGDWIHQLPANVRWMQVEHAYLWERHVTLKAFWRLLLQGREAGESTVLTTALTWISEAVVAGGLIWAALGGRPDGQIRKPKPEIRIKPEARNPNDRHSSNRLLFGFRISDFGFHSDFWFRISDLIMCPFGATATPNPADEKVRRDRFITATITAMPLLMPFYFDYDLLLLAVPAVLYASERISNPERMLRKDRWITARWVALYLWLFVNPAFALHTHVGGSVILLSAVAIASIRRVNRADGEEAPILIIRPQRVAIAA